MAGKHENREIADWAPSIDTRLDPSRSLLGDKFSCFPRMASSRNLKSEPEDRHRAKRSQDRRSEMLCLSPPGEFHDA